MVIIPQGDGYKRRMRKNTLFTAEVAEFTEK